LVRSTSPTSSSLVPSSRLAAVPVTDPRSARPVALFFHALLSFPSGHHGGVVVGMFYLEVTLVQPAWLLFADVPRLLGCSTCAGDPLLIMDRTVDRQHDLAGATAIIAVLLLARGSR
jgi:hypothetical protein